MKIQTLFVPAACALLMMACGGSGTTETAKESKLAKHPWGSFKVGSYVVTKTTTDAAGQKMTTEVKTTLTALTAEKATIEMATTMMGNTSTTSADMPLNAGPTPAAPAEAAAGMPKADVKTSEETLTVAGKSVKCKVTTTSTEAEGMKTESKTWMSEDVPGFVVKTVMKSTGPASSESTSEVTDFKAS